MFFYFIPDECPATRRVARGHTEFPVALFNTVRKGKKELCYCSSHFVAASERATHRHPHSSLLFAVFVARRPPIAHEEKKYRRRLQFKHGEIFCVSEYTNNSQFVNTPSPILRFLNERKVSECRSSPGANRRCFVVRL